MVSSRSGVKGCGSVELEGPCSISVEFEFEGIFRGREYRSRVEVECRGMVAMGMTAFRQHILLGTD